MWALISAFSLLLAAALFREGSGVVDAVSPDASPGAVVVPHPAALTHFEFSEFDSPDVPGSGFKEMDRDFLSRLDAVREDIGYALSINSGYRTRSHNTAVGGVADSSHLKGLAADIHCPTLHHLRHLFDVLKRHGFVRIGQYKTSKGNYFIHVDADSAKAPAFWYSGISKL